MESMTHKKSSRMPRQISTLTRRTLATGRVTSALRFRSTCPSNLFQNGPVRLTLLRARGGVAETMTFASVVGLSHFVGKGRMLREVGGDRALTLIEYDFPQIPTDTSWEIIDPNRAAREADEFPYVHSQVLEARARCRLFKHLRNRLKGKAVEEVEYVGSQRVEKRVLYEETGVLKMEWGGLFKVAAREGKVSWVLLETKTQMTLVCTYILHTSASLL